MSKASLSGTLRHALPRSRSTNNCGTLARNMVTAPRTGRRLLGFPRAIRFVDLPLEVLQADVAAVLDHDHEAARASDAANRWRRKHLHICASGICLREFLARACWRWRRSDSSGERRLELVEDDEHRAEIRAEGVEQKRLARNALAYARFPEWLWRSSRSASMTSLRALDRGRVGQLHVDEQIAHVLRRDETLGRGREVPPASAASSPP